MCASVSMDLALRISDTAANPLAEAIADSGVEDPHLLTSRRRVESRKPLEDDHNGAAEKARGGVTIGVAVFELGEEHGPAFSAEKKLRGEFCVFERLTL